MGSNMHWLILDNSTDHAWSYLFKREMRMKECNNGISRRLKARRGTKIRQEDRAHWKQYQPRPLKEEE